MPADTERQINLSEIDFRLKLLEKTSEKNSENISKSLEKIIEDVSNIKHSFADLRVLDTKVSHIDKIVIDLKDEHDKKANNEKVDGIEKRITSIEENSKIMGRTVIFTLASFVLTILGSLIFIISHTDKVVK